MYSVVIIEDDEWVLRGIQKSFNWEKYDFYVKDTFYDAEPFLKYLDGHHVDVVITDIKIAGKCYYGGPSWYNYGNFFMPLRSVVEALGGTVDYNDENNTADVRFPVVSDGFDYLSQRDDTKPLSFMFDTLTDFEGWQPNSHITAMTLKKGMLRLNISGQDPQLHTPKMSVNSSEYKYLRIRMKNETPTKQAMLLFITSGNPTWGGKQKYIINISSNDKEVKEYIVDLSTAPWSGTITGLRFDPIEPYTQVQGNVYIDSIEFLNEINNEEE